MLQAKSTLNTKVQANPKEDAAQAHTSQFVSCSDSLYENRITSAERLKLSALVLV